MPEQSEAFVQQLRDAGVQRFDWYPMIRGRLVAVNGQAGHARRLHRGPRERLVDREFNLSIRAQPRRTTRWWRALAGRRSPAR